MCVLFLKCFCYVYSLSMIKRQICNYPSAKFIHFSPPVSLVLIICEIPCAFPETL